MDSKIKKHSALRDGFFIAGTVLLLFFSLWKSRYGLGIYDEAFYLTIPYRMCHGDKLFLNEWHVSQLSALLQYPLMKLYLPDMVKRDHGRILNVASIAGFMPGPLMATYYATKNYVVRLSEGVRKELRAKGSKVKISILCPGPVQTNFEKTANITFQFNGTDVNRVARYTLEHLDQFYIVPSLPIRVSRVLVKALPTPVVTSAIFFLQSRRKK